MSGAVGGAPGAVLYSRRGCAPCFVMRRAAARAARRHRVPLRVVDIEGDAGLEARYGKSVPVLVLPEGVAFAGRAAAAAIDGAFRAAAARVPGARSWIGRLARRWRGAGGAG
jgi:hypothetical protein